MTRSSLLVQLDSCAGTALHALNSSKPQETSVEDAEVPLVIDLPKLRHINSSELRDGKRLTKQRAWGPYKNPLSTPPPNTFHFKAPLTLGSVIDSEVGSSVNDDALDGDTETLVETLHAIRLEDLAETVA